jgi:hypothetical protein
MQTMRASEAVPGRGRAAAIKQSNRRVKGSAKCWLQEAPKPSYSPRAAYLSEDDGTSAY